MKIYFKINKIGHLQVYWVHLPPNPLQIVTFDQHLLCISVVWTSMHSFTHSFMHLFINFLIFKSNLMKLQGSACKKVVLCLESSLDFCFFFIKKTPLLSFLNLSLSSLFLLWTMPEMLYYKHFLWLFLKCKSLWIKASAKWINVNVEVDWCISFAN